MKASDSPAEDQRLFVRAQLVFWLLGATDGHAKNFSLFIHPGGGFRLTPLYDVTSAQPTLDANQIPRKKMRLAMSAGDNRHYLIDTIMPRHFVESAENAGVPGSVVREQLRELVDLAPRAIESVTKSLPSGFPRDISSSIARGVEQLSDASLESS